MFNPVLLLSPVPPEVEVVVFVLVVQDEATLVRLRGTTATAGRGESSAREEWEHHTYQRRLSRALWDSADSWEASGGGGPGKMNNKRG